MTNEEAIKALRLINLSKVHPFLTWEEMEDVRDAAIKALEKQIELKPGETIPVRELEAWRVANTINAKMYEQNHSEEFLRGAMWASDIVLSCGEKVEDRNENDKFIAQIKWERDSAIEQLRSYGVNLFEDADVKRVVHGHWIPKECMVKSPFARNHICSNCGADTIEISNYCPNCGSKMDGKEQTDGKS